MKITKLKRGYRINLSDSEMHLLREINSEGIQSYIEMGNDCNGLDPAEKRILTEIQTMKREWL
tara:strand:+ start:2422 stop:2610 length:189 start_codon:yes stop_codon:yes gene_type:complete